MSVFAVVSGLCLIGRELDQVAGDEACSQAEVAENLHEQPAGVAAGARLGLQRFFRRLNACFHARAIGDVAAECDVEIGDELNRGARRTIDLSQVAIQQRLGGGLIEIRPQVSSQRPVIGKGKARSLRINEEVKRVDRRHLGDQIDRDSKLGRLFGKHDTSEKVAERILLPIDVVRRCDVQGIGGNRRAAVGRGPQTNEVGSERDWTLEAIVSAVRQRDLDRHEPLGHGASCRRAN